MFAESLQRGLAAGGWVVGFVAAVGIFAILCWIGIQAMVALLGDTERHRTKGGGKTK